MASSKLGDFLVRAGLITPAQLEEALKCQVIFGGRLGTNLMEMDYLDEAGLTAALSRMLGIPAPTAEQLTNVPAELIKLVPAELAGRYKVIPVERQKNRLLLAMANPHDLHAIDEISFATGLVVSPMVAPELRIYMALEKHYAIRREVRYIRIGDRHFRSGQAPVTEQTPAMFGADEGDDFSFSDPNADFTSGYLSAPAEEPPLLDLTLDAEEPVTAPATTKPPAAPTAAAAPLASTPPPPAAAPQAAAPTAAAAVTPPPAASTPLSADDFAWGLVDANDREAIADLLIRFAGDRFPSAGLFLLRSSAAYGWRASRAGQALSGFDELQVPLDGPSVLQLVASTKSFYQGPIPDTPGNRLLLDMLGGKTGDLVALLPLLLMGRVVNVVYVAGAECTAEAMAELQKVVSKAAMAFEILILKNKILQA